MIPRGGKYHAPCQADWEGGLLDQLTDMGISLEDLIGHAEDQSDSRDGGGSRSGGGDGDCGPLCVALGSSLGVLGCCASERGLAAGVRDPR